MSGKNAVVRTFDKLNFQFYNGDRVGLWGHNGAGKTTLLRMIAGIYEPSGGSISVNGSIISLLNISLGTQEEASGLDNIYLRAALMGLTKKETSAMLEDVIEFTELGDFVHLPLRTYSAGMRLRLNFAISTAVNADIILMDEWLSVGDEAFVEKAEHRLVQMLEKAKILIIASHDKEMLHRLCNRIVVLDHGNIAEDIRI